MSRKPRLVLPLFALILVGAIGYLIVSGRPSHLPPTSTPSPTGPVLKPVEIATQLSGVVSQVAVKEGQAVKPGDLLFTLDDKSFQQAVLSAQSELDQVKSQTKQAIANVGLAGEVGDSKVQSGSGPSGPIIGRISGSAVDLGRFQKGVLDAQQQVSTSQRALQSAQASVSAVSIEIEEAKSKIPAAEARVPGAESDLKEAAAAMALTAQKVDKAKSDADRFQMLLKDGVVSAREAERMTAKYEAAQSTNDAAKDKIRATTDTLNERKQEVEDATTAVSRLEDKLATAKAAVSVAEAKVKAAVNFQLQTSAKLESARKSVHRVRGFGDEVMGAIAQAGLAPVAVQVQAVPPQVTAANVQKAEVALKAAQDKLNLVRLYATVSGRVELRGLAVGTKVDAGVPVVAILPAK